MKLKVIVICAFLFLFTLLVFLPAFADSYEYEVTVNGIKSKISLSENRFIIHNIIGIKHWGAGPVSFDRAPRAPVDIMHIYRESNRDDVWILVQKAPFSKKLYPEKTMDDTYFYFFKIVKGKNHSFLIETAVPKYDKKDTLKDAKPPKMFRELNLKELK